MSRLLVIPERRTDSRIRVRVQHCPMCQRSLMLDNVGVVDEDGEGYDLTAVMVAQHLHVRQCTG